MLVNCSGFFLSGKIKIQDILACSFLDDLLELRDEELPKDAQESNWFSAPSALRVYGKLHVYYLDHHIIYSNIVGVITVFTISSWQ